MNTVNKTVLTHPTEMQPEHGAPDAATSVWDTVCAVRKRVCDLALASLSDRECMAVALAATAVRDREAILGMLLNSYHLKRVLPAVESVALSNAEWETLCDRDMLDERAQHLNAEPVFSKTTSSLQDAMKCSLLEGRARGRWARHTTKIACYVALHSDSAEELVCACLGGIVKADSRRLDEVRSDIEESGTDDLLLSRAVMLLAEAILR